MSGYAWLGANTSDRELAPATSSTTSSSSTAPHKGAWLTAIPADFRLPHEDVDRWRPNPDDNGMWLLHPCLDIHGGELLSGYPSDDDRTDWRSIFTRDVEYFAFEQLAVYPDGGTADEAMQQMRAALTTCARQSADVEGDEQRRHRESFWGTKPVELSGGTQPADAFHAYNWNRWYDAKGDLSYRLGGPFITVVRIGNAILLVGWDGETDWSSPGVASRAARQTAADLRPYLRELCVFAPDAHC